MQVFTIEKVGNLHECTCVASKASNMSEASPNSWGFGGAVSPPMGSRGEAPGNFLILDPSDAWK